MVKINDAVTAAYVYYGLQWVILSFDVPDVERARLCKTAATCCAFAMGQGVTVYKPKYRPMQNPSKQTL